MGEIFWTASCVSVIWENGVGVGCRLLFSLIIVGRNMGLFVAIGATVVGDSIVGVPF